jgi:Putative metal-binding motif
MDCAGLAPSGHAAADGDCDDTRDTVHPDAVELCNQRDDDCDTEVDEDAIPIPLYPDGDDDGYYGQLEAMSLDVVMGCVGTPDYAGEPGDCEPEDPTKHPGAEEVCNLYDDNCDGRADERVRPICGVGWCAREAWTCELANCDPGEPQSETCNLLDDDCDDEIDEDVECPEGAACVAGECRPIEGGGETGDSDAGGTGAASGVGPAPTGTGDADETDGAAGCACQAIGTRGSPASRWLVFLVLWQTRRRS